MSNDNTANLASSNKKIGARVLKSEELLAILPTYDKLKGQIDEMRANAKSRTTNRGDSYTNNIGVLGARGTGKTSVLKTLNAELTRGEEQKEQGIHNILLPMIIPETMSECMNLMSTILGLFKQQIEKMSEAPPCRNKQCWEREPNRALESFNKLIKKFCYMQSEFRSILVQQYTTDSEYAKNSSQVFNSDTEFLPAFNSFIDELLKDPFCAEDAMIFLMIDDIDLCTHRCTDVVKTLLSYINHPRMITIISGDLDTFEEALTLDFLRQEHALDGNLLQESFMQNTDDNQLMTRKKLLSYEYLKKILPPIYRHTVKRWSLEERGTYQISLDANGDAMPAENTCLGDLLVSTFRNYGCAAYFKCDAQVHDDPEEKDPEQKFIPQVFHLFDDTARGLNNVYYTLLNEHGDIEVYGNELAKRIEPKVGERGREEKAFHSIRLFLETMVASHRTLSNYRTLLLQDIVQFGTDFSSSFVRFDNLLYAVYDRKKDNPTSSNENTTGRNKAADKDKTRPHKIPDAVTRFTLFLFCDFAQRLLSHSEENEAWPPEYAQCRVQAMRDLLNHPIISGSTQAFKKKVNLTGSNTKLTIDKIDTTKLGILGLFVFGEFVFLLHYIQYAVSFSEDEHRHLMKAFNIPSRSDEDETENENKDVTKAEAKAKAINDQFYLNSYGSVVSLINQTRLGNGQKTKEQRYESMTKSSPHAVQILNTVPKLYAGSLNLILLKILEGRLNSNSFLKKRLLLNSLVSTLGDKVFTEEAYLAPFDDVLEEKLKSTEITSEQISILKIVATHSLWNSDDNNLIKDFLDDKVNEIIKLLKNALEHHSVTVDSKKLAWLENKSETNTGLGYLSQKWAKQKGEYGYDLTVANLETFMGSANGYVRVYDCSSSSNQMSVNGYCNNHYLHRYKADVLHLRDYLYTLTLNVGSFFTDEYVYWFYFYAIMRQASGELEGVYQESLRAAQLTKLLSEVEIMEAKATSAQYESLLDPEEVEAAFGKKPLAGPSIITPAVTQDGASEGD